jgi:hypothetical protein
MCGLVSQTVSKVNTATRIARASFIGRTCLRGAFFAHNRTRTCTPECGA